MTRIIIEDCTVVIIAACVAIGGFVEVRKLPLHEHNYCTLAYHQYAIGLSFGLLLGGIVLSMLNERTSKTILIGIPLLLLTSSPLLMAIYSERVIYWQLYIPSCLVCAFAGVALGYAAKTQRMLKSLDRRVIVLLAWICTFGVVGLFVNNAFRQEIRKLRITTFLTALMPIGLGILGLWGAINADRLLFHLGENPPICFKSFLGATIYIVSTLVVSHRELNKKGSDRSLNLLSSSRTAPHQAE